MVFYFISSIAFLAIYFFSFFLLVVGVLIYILHRRTIYNQRQTANKLMKKLCHSNMDQGNGKAGSTTMKYSSLLSNWGDFKKIITWQCFGDGAAGREPCLSGCWGGKSWNNCFGETTWQCASNIYHEPRKCACAIIHIHFEDSILGKRDTILERLNVYRCSLSVIYKRGALTRPRPVSRIPPHAKPQGASTLPPNPPKSSC